LVLNEQFAYYVLLVLDRDSRRSMAVALVLAVVLLYFAFRGVDWADLLRQIRSARPELALVAFAAYSCSYLCRALRWSVLLRAGGPLSVLTAFWGTAVGYLGNAFLPGRAGEVIRSAMVSRATHLDVGYVLATAMTERVFDAAALVVIGLAALATVSNLPPLLVDATRVMAIVAAVGLGCLLLAPRFESVVMALLDRVPFVGRRRAKLREIAGKFLMGLRAIQDPSRAIRFLGLTAVIWAIDAVAVTMIARALDTPLSIALAFILIAALGLSSAAPSTPGYVGVYQIVAVSVLGPFGIGQSPALALILLLQAITYCVILFWGLPGLWRLSLAQPKAVEPAR
jgi:uncharacterized protein (TIRG00374 family)